MRPYFLGSDLLFPVGNPTSDQGGTINPQRESALYFKIFTKNSLGKQFPAKESFTICSFGLFISLLLMCHWSPLTLALFPDRLVEII